jgi:hypothetical protein
LCRSCRTRAEGGLINNGIDAMKDMDGTRELAIKSQRAENEHLMPATLRAAQVFT